MKPRPQIISRDGKPAFVVLPIEERERILAAIEDADDVRLLDAARRYGGEFVPAKVANAILDGANPIKVLREHRGLTQATLAKAAGRAPIYISQLETGVRRGSVKTLKAIAKALSVDWELLAS